MGKAALPWPMPGSSEQAGPRGSPQPQHRGDADSLEAQGSCTSLAQPLHQKLENTHAQVKFASGDVNFSRACRVPWVLGSF